MRITSVLLALASLTAAQPTKPTPSSSPSASASVLFQLSINPSWFENLAVRPNGQIIATRVDVPELWLIDPVQHTGNLLVTVPGITSAIGIAQVRPDVYVFVGGNFTLATATIVPQSAKVFELDMTCSPPVVKLIKELPQAGLLNGVCKLGRDTVLIAEYALGGVYRLDTKKGTVATVLDATQAPNANGVHVFHQQLYFSSTANKTLFKVPINADGEPTGPITTVHSGSVIDDFIIEPGGTVYLAANAINEIIRVAPDGTSSVLVGSLDSFEVAGVTAIALGPDFKGGETLYATTSGGAVAPIHNQTEPAKIVEVKIFESCEE